MSGEVVYIYPHILDSPKSSKKIEALMLKHHVEFVYYKRTFETINKREAEKKFDKLIEEYGRDNVRLVALGYSPLVAILYHYAVTHGVRAVILEERENGEFEEIDIGGDINGEVF